MQRIYALILGVLFSASLTGQENSGNLNADLTAGGLEFFEALIHGTQLQKSPYKYDLSALPLLKEALNFYKEKGDSCGMGKTYGVIARTYYEARSEETNVPYIDSAASYFIWADALLNSSCNAFDIYYTYNSWGILKNQVEQYQDAEKKLEVALQAASMLDTPIYRQYVLINLSISAANQDNLKRAIAITKTVLAEALKTNNEYLIQRGLQNLGSFYIDLPKYDSAEFYLLQLKERLNPHASPQVAMDMYNNLGLCYQKKGDLIKARDYLEKAIEFSEEYEVNSNFLNSYYNLARVYHKLGNGDEAWKYLNKYINLEKAHKAEEINRIEANAKIELEKERTARKALDLKLEIEKSKLMQERTQRESYVFYSIVFGLFFILIAVYSRLRYIRRSKKIVEAEKKRSDELLRNILPEEVAEELKDKGESAARNFNNVTVLFTDFIDFTSISAKKSPAEIVEDMNYYFKKFDEIVTQFGIEKIKTIGDSFMAAGGVPVEFPNSAKATVLAALEMIKVVQERNRENELANKLIFNIRIGMHTGPVVAGIVGLKKFQYDIWGDTVNTASRMESNCEPNRVNISKSTYDLIKDEPEFAFEKRGKIETKGKGKLDMYFVSYA